AKATGLVWYYSGSNQDDQINVDYVTEPGTLSGHHLITRLTNNNGHFTFDAQVELDFEAKDANGKLIWDPSRHVIDTVTGLPDGTTVKPDASGLLLPAEGNFLAIIIDAKDGNDQINVGPTVIKSVWIDAGAGDDHVNVAAPEPILPDLAES